MKKVLLPFVIVGCLALVSTAQAQPPAAAPAQPPASPAAAAPAAPPVPLTDADVKGLSGPKAEDKAKGDPGGTISGNVSDIPVGDMKKGLTLADVVNQI